MRLPTWISQHLAALRALLVLTVLTGVLYPLAITGIAQLPGLHHNANGSMIKTDDTTVGSAIIGQGFVDSHGNPLTQYFQTRPSAAGNGWDPTASGASNLGPESIRDTLPDPSVKDDTGKQSLLTQVCARSLAVGKLERVNSARPYCTNSGVGAVLGVFYRDGSTGPVTRVVSLNQACPATPFMRTYQGVRVECATPGSDYSRGVITPVHGAAPARPAGPGRVPAPAAGGRRGLSFLIRLTGPAGRRGIL